MFAPSGHSAGSETRFIAQPHAPQGRDRPRHRPHLGPDGRGRVPAADEDSRTDVQDHAYGLCRSLLSRLRALCRCGRHLRWAHHHGGSRRANPLRGGALLGGPLSYHRLGRPRGALHALRLLGCAGGPLPPVWRAQIRPAREAFRHLRPDGAPRLSADGGTVTRLPHAQQPPHRGARCRYPPPPVAPHPGRQSRERCGRSGFCRPPAGVHRGPSGVRAAHPRQGVSPRPLSPTAHPPA